MCEQIKLLFDLWLDAVGVGVLEAFKELKDYISSQPAIITDPIDFTLRTLLSS